jgi:hypothetical protein
MVSDGAHTAKRAVLSARVSTEEQARSGYSLARQLEALREHAAREGYKIAEEPTWGRVAPASTGPAWAA